MSLLCYSSHQRTRLLIVVKQLNRQTGNRRFWYINYFFYAFIYLFCNCYSIDFCHFNIFSRTRLRLRDAAFEMHPSDHVGIH